MTLGWTLICSRAMVGIWLWRWAEDNGFSLLTKGIPNLFCIIWECLPLIIPEMGTSIEVGGMHLHLVKRMINIIHISIMKLVNSCMILVNIMLIDLPLDKLDTLSSILLVILL